ncbi:MAG: chemotaxis protein CheW [Planctomycetota bacterium]
MQDNTTTASNTADTEGGSPHGGKQLQLVTFEVSSEEFAVDILAVQEINRMMELTRVPASPPAVEGVINLRGKIIPVLDLRKRFGMNATDKTDQMRIIVVEVHNRVIGFIVDRVHEVLRIGSSIVEPAPAMVCSIDSEFIAGVGKLEDRLLILLDLEKLFDAGLVDAATNAAPVAA